MQAVSLPPSLSRYQGEAGGPHSPLSRSQFYLISRTFTYLLKPSIRPLIELSVWPIRNWIIFSCSILTSNLHFFLYFLLMMQSFALTQKHLISLFFLTCLTLSQCPVLPKYLWHLSSPFYSHCFYPNWFQNCLIVLERLLFFFCRYIFIYLAISTLFVIDKIKYIL